VMQRRKAFTLIEVLISIALLSIVMLGLYSALDMQRSSNKHLFQYLTKAIDSDKAIMVLYRDILYSDGNLTIKKSEYDRFCINSTTNSLYGLSQAKVCWVVAKDNNQLLRIEGNGYQLPLRYEDRVAIDQVMDNIVQFDITRNKGDDKVVAILQASHEKPYTFMLQGIIQPKLNIKKKVKKKSNPPQEKFIPNNDENKT